MAAVEGPKGNIAEIIKGNQTATGETVSRATNSTTSDKDMFLKLLLAQMKYQDPMNPTDSTQYLSQMAQFTTVEKLETMVNNTGSLLTASQMQSALGMVGATVEYGVGDKAGKGVVTGITMVEGTPQLLVDGKTKVPLGDLTSVMIAGTTAPPASETPDESQKSAAYNVSQGDDTGTI
jgi:flagellar basal-body rod modification protein FlgD